MQEKDCELCGVEVEPKDIERYYVVPREIVEQTDIQRPRTVRLCPDCHEELLRWYTARVAEETYDTKVKRFRVRSPQEMVKEYERAFQRFTQYKKEQQRIS